MIFTNILSILLFLVFLILGSIHFYWAFGGRWRILQAIPKSGEEEKVLYPSFLATMIVGIGLCLFGLFYLIETELFIIDLPNRLLQIGGWVIPIIFLLRAIGEFKYVGFFKKINHTDFARWDTQLYVPLCLFIGLSGTVIVFFH